MKTEQTINFIEWFKQLLLQFENLFHEIQAWFEGTIMKQDWYKNLTATPSDAEETTA